MPTDPPIVDVPITGGIEFGGTSNQWTTNGVEPGNGTEWGQYQWFDPIAFYCQQTESDGSKCAFWCKMCAGQFVPTLMNTATLQGSAPQYPAFTPANVTALGLCEIFWLWVFSAWWSSVTGNQEGPPQALTGGGGGNPGGGGG